MVQKGKQNKVHLVSATSFIFCYNIPYENCIGKLWWKATENVRWKNNQTDIG
ncbi:hypothetical protein SSUR61_1960 [Streptococcus suis R61]|uniref:Uncharacterized protein n=1 Tax=Streptococcus suis R61 TaxID=996306 RepID=A0AA87F7N1_STRSU|nr:hypothetical protein SSUR61_1960 [Streptococcus suis R61]